MNEQLQTKLFDLWGTSISLSQVVMAVLLLLVLSVGYWLLSRKILPRYFKREIIKIMPQWAVRRIIFYFFALLAIIAVMWCLGLDYVLFERGNIRIRLITLLEALAIVQLARLADWVISKLLLYNYEKNLEDDKEYAKSLAHTVDKKQLGNRTVQYIVYLFAAILVLQSFEIDYTLFSYQYVPIRISSVLVAVLVILVARLLSWVLTQLFMFRYYRRKKVNVGSRFAINQLLKYIIYVFAFFIAIESLGVKMTVIWGGMAALLVGVGLGLQQTFNDFLSGILLLFERNVKVGHVVQIGDLVGTVVRIGLRNSIVETRQNVSVIVPNSKLVTDSVVNWTHNDDKVRFTVPVGVAYGSDTALVKSILLQVAKDNIYVLDKPTPLVRFTNFGDSSLDFELLIWSRNFIVIEDIKSDLRFEIDRLFREKGVEIPFPQRDIWMRGESG